MCNQIVKAHSSGCQQAHTDAHAAQDGRLFSEMGVQDLEGHPVPVAKRDLTRLALVIADDDHFAAHACDVAKQGKRRLPANHFESGIGALSIGQGLDNFRQRFFGDIHHMTGSQTESPLQRVGTGVRHDQPPRPLHGDQFLYQVAHEPGADDDHVIAQREVRHFNGVDRAGQGFSKCEIQRKITSGEAELRLHNYILGKAAARRPDCHPVALSQSFHILPDLSYNTADLMTRVTRIQVCAGFPLPQVKLRGADAAGRHTYEDLVREQRGKRLFIQLKFLRTR